MNKAPESLRYGGHVYNSPPPKQAGTRVPVTPGSSPSVGAGYTQMSPAQLAQLQKEAVRYSPSKAGGAMPPPPDGARLVAKDVTSIIEVPTVQKVESKVEGYGVVNDMEKKLVKVKKMVPVEKYKEIEETVVEVLEKPVTKVRQVWKLVDEEYTEIVKEPVTVKRPVKVPYTDYEERLVDEEILVPVERKVVTEGVRTDEKIVGQKYEVKQTELYKTYEHFAGYGGIEVRELGSGTDYGVTKVGTPVYGGSASNVAAARLARSQARR